MINRSFKRSKTVILSLIAAAMLAFPANAANVRGKVTDVDGKTISGWAWNPEDTNDVQEVEVHICQAGDPLPIKYLHVTANKYREDLVADLKDGWHGFSAEVDWSSLRGSSCTIKAYAVKDGKYYALGDSVRYNKASGASVQSTPAQKPTGSNLSAAAAPTASVTAQPSAPAAVAPIPVIRRKIPMQPKKPRWVPLCSAATVTAQSAAEALASPFPAPYPSRSIRSLPT